jgi:FkbH-like protein
MGIDDVKSLRKQGRIAEALDLLRRELSEGNVAAEKLDAAGRAVLGMLASPGAPSPAYQVLLLGQCTTSFLKTALVSVAHGQGTLLRVEEGGYDSVLQDLATAASRPDAVIILPWHQRLLAGDARSASARIQDELEYFRQVWDHVLGRGSRLIQVGFDWTGPGAEGYGLGASAQGPVGLVRAMDAALRDALPKGAFFVDLQQVAGSLGRRAFYDPRAYYWTKQPFSWPGLELLSRHLWAGIRALTTGPKKVLALDLDNTLWGGVVGEEGPLGIRLGGTPEGEAFIAFQKYCKALGERGIVLAVCSKNNPADAREAFEKNPDMILRLDNFAAFEASWDPKSVALQRAADTLRLGLDSFVFMDDNPAERRQVRMALPMVDVVEAPEDPAHFIRALEEGLYFEAASITVADHERNEQYQSEARRREHEQKSGSIEEYLTSLEMRADVRPITADDLPRVVQLIGKTNQFNLTTRRYSEGDLGALLGAPGNLALSLRLQDRFGDYGLISIVLGVPDPTAGHPALRLDVWLMSCRAIARGVESYLLNRVAAAARELGYRSLLGEYIATAKNELVADLYPKLGFDPLEPSRVGSARFVLNLSAFAPRPTAVTDL